MFKHILVPTDGSEISRAVEDKAVEFAGEIGARLSFLHVVEAMPIPVAGLSRTEASSREFKAREAELDRQILERALGRARAAGVHADTLKEIHDSPYVAIIAAAERLGCDLIFMASHGRRGLEALLLGSETQKVLTHCKVPVLVFR